MKKVIISPYSKQLPFKDENPKNYPYWPELVNILKEHDCYITQLIFSKEKAIKNVDTFLISPSNISIKESLEENDFFICVDTAFQHIANYYDKTGVVIWGPSDPLLFGYKDNVNILKSRKGLRKNQYGQWFDESFNIKLFPKPEKVFETIKHLII